MKRQFLRNTWRVAPAALGLSLISVRPARAQIAVEPQASSPATHNRFIRVKNLPPNVLAFWLDPRDNVRPVEFTLDHLSPIAGDSQWVPNPQEFGAIAERLNGPANVAPVPANALLGPTMVMPETDQETNRLPEGVDRVIAIDPQSALLAHGTNEGLDRVQALITKWDHPLPGVTLAVQYIEVSTSDTAAFGIDFPPVPQVVGTPGTTAAPVNPLFAGRVYGLFAADLAALQNANRAKVTGTANASAVNNFAADLPLVTENIVKASAVPNSRKVSDPQTYPPSVNAEIRLTVLPAINRDGTVNLTVTPSFSVPADAGFIRFESPVIQGQTLNWDNLHDGDMVAIGGLKTMWPCPPRELPPLSRIPITDRFFSSPSDLEEELIIFVKVNITHFPGRDQAGTGG